MDFLKFCKDYRIPIAPPGHKHERHGWINIPCPFCIGNPGFHLGFQQTGGWFGFVCFRCGGHGGVATISALLKIRAEEARRLIEEYGDGVTSVWRKKRVKTKTSTNLMLPPGLQPLGARAKQYLERRDFDPEKLEREFELKDTGLGGHWKGRVFIPIFVQDRMISYTCRSYVGSETRYLSCSSEKEVSPHADNLYHADNLFGHKRVVVVEGCADVWRLGNGAVATFGTKVTASQLKLLCKFQRIFLLRDLDEAGRIAWDKIGARLRLAGVELKIIKPSDISLTAKDAGEFTQQEADYLMRSL